MKINIPKVIVPIDMAEYAPELAGTCLHVWVNPTLNKMNEHASLAASALSVEVLTSDNLLAWYLDLWNQGPAETHWTLEELHDLEEKDPAFLSWMITVTWNARREHMDRKKKV